MHATLRVAGTLCLVVSGWVGGRGNGRKSWPANNMTQDTRAACCMEPAASSRVAAVIRIRAMAAMPMPQGSSRLIQDCPVRPGPVGAEAEVSLSEFRFDLVVFCVSCQSV